MRVESRQIPELRCRQESSDMHNETHAVYSLNGGGSTITLETSDSDIEIRKMSAGK